jgi:hypothetical protein
MVGLGANNDKGQIDNVTVQRIPPAVTLDRTVEFSSGATDLLEPPLSGTWTIGAGRYEAIAPIGGTAVDLLSVHVDPASFVQLNSTLKTSAQGGFVFDYYGSEDFKFVTVSVETKQILLGHHTLKAGWVIDAALANTGLNSVTDYSLGVTLKGSTVSVTVNDQSGLSYAYNALVTDGSFGLLARNGQVSFDTVNVKTDDPSFAQPAQPTISISDPSFTEGNSGSATAFVNLTLSQEAASPVTVEYTTVNGTATAGSDYLSQSGTVTFAPGETSIQVGFTVYGDTVFEPDETFSILLSNPVGAQLGDDTGTITIVNDDASPMPNVFISDVSVIEGRLGKTSSATVTLSLSNPSTERVTVILNTADGTAKGGVDYATVSNASITFEPGITSKLYAFTVYGDGTVEGDEVFYAQLSNAVGATITDGTGQVTILNDDRAKVQAVTGGDSKAILSSEDLAPIVEEAINRWETVLGENATVLDNLSFTITDLQGLTLGETLSPSVILIDTNAAGNGWFIDPTPADDVEFVNVTSPSGVDLLTVVMHEMGHVLGYDDLDPVVGPASLMSAKLEEGVRYLPGDSSTDESDLIDLNVRPAENMEHCKVSLVKPWLVRYLLDGAQDNPNSNISIVLGDSDHRGKDPAPAVLDSFLSRWRGKKK